VTKKPGYKASGVRLQEIQDQLRETGDVRRKGKVKKRFNSQKWTGGPGQISRHFIPRDDRQGHPCANGTQSLSLRAERSLPFRFARGTWSPRGTEWTV